MEFRQQTLDNGLEIVAECNPQAYSAALAFFVKTGSRDETDALSGVSHFLEHMVFKGTERRSAEDVNRELDEICAGSNAFTSEEQTVYHATFLPERQADVVALLSDIMRPALRASDFEMEKQVILEEIAMYEDQPPFRAHEKCMTAHFGEHPLANSVLGSVESVSALNAAQMEAYFQQRYSPQNIALVATGNVDFEQLVQQADSHCGRWQAFATERATPRAAQASSRVHMQKDTSFQHYMIQICNGPAAADEDRYAARALATIFGDDGGSRLFWEFVDTGLAEYAWMHCYEFQGTGIIMTDICSSPEQAEGNLQRLADLQTVLAQQGITEEELQRAKNKITSQVVLQSERPAHRLMSVGSGWVQRQAYRSVREVLEAYQTLTCDDVNAVLSRYPLSPNTTFTIGPNASA